MDSWQFSPREDGVEIGLGGNASGSFTNDLFFNLAREVLQNSLDASAGGKVRVSFSIEQLKAADLPGIESLKSHLEDCLAHAKSKNHRPTIAYFEQGIKNLTKKPLDVLKISDYGTTGMTGPYVPGAGFFAYMKGVGQGGKEKASGLTGGSHGLGKITVENVSTIKTQFVSSKWFDESTKNQGVFFQGRSSLISRYDSTGKLLNPEGYFGNENYSAIEDEAQIPSWAKREEFGSDTFVIAFNRRAYFPKALIAATVQNFFQAVLDGKLEVEVLGQKIDASNISKFASGEEIVEHIKEVKNQPEDFEKTKFILEAMTSNQAKVFPRQDQAFGHVQLRILKRDDAPQKVCFLRNGMVITTEQPSLKRFQNCSDFIAVFECLNDTGLEYFRSLEPPAHDQFDYEVLYDEKEKSKARRDLTNLTDWIRDKVKEVAQRKVKESSDIDWVSKLFPKDEEAFEGKESPEINPDGEVVIEFKPSKLPQRKTNVPTVAPVEPDGPPEEPVDPLPNPNPGPNPPEPGPEPTPSPEPSPKDGPEEQPRLLGDEVGLIEIRHRGSDTEWVELFFTPTKSGSIAVQIQVMGADTAQPLYFEEAKAADEALTLINSNSRALIVVEQHKRIKLSAKLVGFTGGALRVVANEV